MNSNWQLSTVILNEAQMLVQCPGLPVKIKENVHLSLFIIGALANLEENTKKYRVI